MAPQTKLPTDPSKLMLVSDERLLSAYSPVRKDTVFAELERRHGTTKVVGFRLNGTVAEQESAKYILELAEGEDPLDSIMIDGIPSPLYAIGESPIKLRAEDPLNRGKTLRGTEERSTENNLVYQGVPTEVRQFLRVMLELSEQRDSGMPNLKDPFALDTLWTLVGQGLSALQKRFPTANARYLDLQRRGQLPTLLVEKGGISSAAAQQTEAERLWDLVLKAIEDRRAPASVTRIIDFGTCKIGVATWRGGDKKHAVKLCAVSTLGLPLAARDYCFSLEAFTNELLKLVAGQVTVEDALRGILHDWGVPA